MCVYQRVCVLRDLLHIPYVYYVLAVIYIPHNICTMCTLSMYLIYVPYSCSNVHIGLMIGEYGLVFGSFRVCMYVCTRVRTLRTLCTYSSVYVYLMYIL